MSQFQLLPTGQLLVPETLETKVTNLLREAVISGRLQPKTTLRIHQIAKELGVSATPVNNALKRLEVEGYVAIAPRKGFYIVPLSYEQLEELVVQRVAIEGFAVERAIPHMTSRDIKMLEDLVARMDTALQDEHADSVRMFALDQEFHLSMYRPAGRPTLIDTISALRDRCRAYMHMASTVGVQHMEQSQVTHRQLVKACKDHDVEGAKSLIAHDIRRMLGSLASLLHTSDEVSA